MYKYFLRHWFITALIVTIPSYWFILFRFFGKQLGLVDTSDKLLPSATIIFIILFIVSFVFTLLKNYNDKVSDENCTNNQYILEKILSGINSVSCKKYNRYASYIKSNYGKTGLNAFEEITQPMDEIANLLEEIRICFSDILGINRDNIGGSIIYKYDTSEKWDWFYTMNISGELNISEIMGNSCTPARQIADGKTSSIFYADKKVGISENRYVPDRKDEVNGLIGSIICRDISVEIDGKKCVSAILHISTYGAQICNAEDDNAKHTILSIILPPYEERIKLELALSYIKNVLASKN